MITSFLQDFCLTNGKRWVLPPLSNSWMISIIWLYIALNRTPNIGCCWGGAVPKERDGMQYGWGAQSNFEPKLISRSQCLIHTCSTSCCRSILSWESDELSQVSQCNERRCNRIHCGGRSRTGCIGSEKDQQERFDCYHSKACLKNEHDLSCMLNLTPPEEVLGFGFI